MFAFYQAEACNRRSSIISPQLPCILESPFSARVRLLASSLIRLFSSTKSLMRSSSEKRCFDSLSSTCSTFSGKSFRFFPNGRSKLLRCSEFSLVKSSVLLLKMRLERFSNSVLMRLCKASASSVCNFRRSSHCFCCSASLRLKDFSCSARRSAVMVLSRAIRSSTVRFLSSSRSRVACSYCGQRGTFVRLSDTLQPTPTIRPIIRKTISMLIQSISRCRFR